MELNEEIAKLAYELYEKSGWISGRDLDNWLTAEKMISERSAAALLGGRVKQIEVTAVVRDEEASKMKAEKGSEGTIVSKRQIEKLKSGS